VSYLVDHLKSGGLGEQKMNVIFVYFSKLCNFTKGGPKIHWNHSVANPIKLFSLLTKNSSIFSVNLGHFIINEFVSLCNTHA